MGAPIVERRDTHNIALPFPGRICALVDIENTIKLVYLKTDVCFGVLIGKMTSRLPTLDWRGGYTTLHGNYRWVDVLARVLGRRAEALYCNLN